MHQIFKYYDEHYCTNNELLIITTFVICSLGDKIFVCDLYNIPIISEIVIRWEGDKKREIQTGVFLLLTREWFSCIMKRNDRIQSEFGCISIDFHKDIS